MAWDACWEKIFSEREWGKYPSESVIRFMAKYFYKAPDRSAVKVLDLGCGTGTVSWYCAREGFTVFGIDGSATGVRRAQERFAREGLKGEFRVGDITELPYADGSFDAVIDGFAMAANDRESHAAILKEVRRVLKPGGLFYSIFPDVDTTGYGSGVTLDRYVQKNLTVGPFAQEGTIYFFDEDEIKRQFQGFTVESLEMLRRTFDNRQGHCTEWVFVGRP